MGAQLDAPEAAGDRGDIFIGENFSVEHVGRR
jgi:hypothetical protein